jgi:hypothetical protein
MRGSRVSPALACILLAACGFFALLLVDTPTGTAARPPSEQEEAELLHAAAHGLGAGDDLASGFELSGVRISTLDGRWAAARLDLSNEEGVVQGDGLAIFEHRSGTWNLDFYDFEHGGPGDCGPGASIPMSIPVQLDLRLPSCPLGPSTLGEDAAVPDASGDLVTEPRSMTVEAKNGSLRFVDIGAWETWRVNRGARARAFGTLLKSGSRKRVRITLHGYRRCGGEVTFRRLEWAELRHGEGVPGHHLHLTCPASGASRGRSSYGRELFGGADFRYVVRAPLRAHAVRAKHLDGRSNAAINRPG